MYDHSVEDKSLYIQKRYPVTDDEYQRLEDDYGKLCWFTANRLISPSNRSSEDLDDFHSEITIGMIRAGSYFKRQTFIEDSFEYANIIKMNLIDKEIIENLSKIWCFKKAAFAEKEENELYEIISKYKNTGLNIPNRTMPLKFDEKFSVYCKAIIWNTFKAIGMQQSKENSVRKGEVSLDEWSFLGGSTVNSISHVQSHNDFQVVKKSLSNLEDKRPLKTFNVLSDPNNYDSVFKQKKSGELKINVVRRKTKMSYKTINNMLYVIQKTIVKEGLADSNQIKKKKK